MNIAPAPIPININAKMNITTTDILKQHFKLFHCDTNNEIPIKTHINPNAPNPYYMRSMFMPGISSTFCVPK